MNNIQKLERQLKAMANRRRLEILSCIKKHKHVHVGAIAKEVDLRIFSTSQHLRILRNAGIVDFKKQGPAVHYFLCEEQVGPVRFILNIL